MRNALRDYERDQLLTKAKRPPAEGMGEQPAAKRASCVPSASASRRFRVAKAWSARKQPMTEGMPFLSICEGDVVIAVGEVDMGAIWMEVELANGLGRGNVPIQTSKGACRLVEINDVPSAVEVPVAASSDEDEDGEEAAAEVRHSQEVDDFAAHLQQEKEEAARRPPLDLVATEVTRIFEDEQEFTMEDFMEDDALSSYDSKAVEEVLAQLARISPDKLIIDWGMYPPYQRPA